MLWFIHSPNLCMFIYIYYRMDIPWVYCLYRSPPRNSSKSVDNFIYNVQCTAYVERIRHRGMASLWCDYPWDEEQVICPFLLPSFRMSSASAAAVVSRQTILDNRTRSVELAAEARDRVESKAPPRVAWYRSDSRKIGGAWSASAAERRCEVMTMTMTFQCPVTTDDDAAVGAYEPSRRLHA